MTRSKDSRAISPSCLPISLPSGSMKIRSRPCPDTVLLPYLEVFVVYYGVVYLVTEYCLPNVIRGLFRGEFGRMDPDDPQLPSVLILQFPQLRKYVHAVDSTIGPKIQEHHLAKQVLKFQRLLCVQPFHTRRKFGAVSLPAYRRGLMGTSPFFAAAGYTIPFARWARNATQRTWELGILYSLKLDLKSSPPTAGLGREVLPVPESADPSRTAAIYAHTSGNCVMRSHKSSMALNPEPSGRPSSDSR